MKLVRMIRLMMTLAVLLAAVAPVSAERLVISLSTHRVLITSSVLAIVHLSAVQELRGSSRPVISMVCSTLLIIADL